MRAQPSKTESLRFFLRSATFEHHQRLDAHFSRLDLSKLADYRIFLGVSAAALLPLEDLLESTNIFSLFPDWPRRKRGASLRADCMALSVDISPLALFRSNLSESETAGMLYVLEGSRLGAKLLLRQLHHAQGGWISRTQTYLGHGLSEQLWPSFVLQLEQLAPRLSAQDAAKGAHYAFSIFETAAREHLKPVRASVVA